MTESGFLTTVDTYFGRVTKAHIIDAVKETKGEGAGQLIDHLKKTEMAKEAEWLLAGTTWLPEPLRLPDLDTINALHSGDAEDELDEELPNFLN